MHFPAWTFNSRIPGPTLRCRQGDLLRVRFVNDSSHPHTMHFHGIHPAEMDGVPMVGRGVISPGESFTYTFEAEPFGVHLYHCHVGPLAEHIARGMYGTFIVGPPKDRAPADELVMVMHGYNTTFDGEGNQLYAVNGIPFHYMHEPVRVRRGELVRIYLVNILEYDPVNSFHLHGNFFDYYPTGRGWSQRSSSTRSSKPRVSAASASCASRIPAGTCSTRTRPSSPTWAGWASSR